MKKFKVYIAGKVSPDSVFGRHDWRDGFCMKLSELSGFEFINLDPTKSEGEFDLDENNSKLIFGRDCFMIKSADLVIVNLTDDISVGGSQEMLIAKYYHKPLIGIAPKGGKFFKDEKEIIGKIYKNWIHPFVAVPCDAVVEDINEVANFIKESFSKSDNFVKGIEIMDETLIYYEKYHHKNDQMLQDM
ncbi:MAG: hypothetical protein PHQ18_03685 [Patescibacteria group bacterium]|nr:hypothetical protein [Patescibacteria group bacterium]